MRILVTFASRHGATAEIAREIAAVLARRGYDPSVRSVEDVTTLEPYDAVVLGSAVYIGRWLKPAAEFVDRNREALAARPVWLFSSGPIGDPPKPDADPIDVAAISDETHAREHRVLAGRLDKKRLTFGEKAIALAVHASEGDFRDWTAIREWAMEIADDLADRRPSAARRAEL